MFVLPAAFAGMPVVSAGLPAVDAGLHAVEAGLPAVGTGLRLICSVLPSVYAGRYSELVPESSREFTAVLIAVHAGDLHHRQAALREFLRCRFHFLGTNIPIYGVPVIIAEAVLELRLGDVHQACHFIDRDPLVHMHQDILACLFCDQFLGVCAVRSLIRTHLDLISVSHG